MTATKNLSPTMIAALLASEGNAVSGAGVHTEAALIRRGLAVAVIGDTYRTNRYSFTSQRVYDVYLGARLTDEGKRVRDALRG